MNVWLPVKMMVALVGQMADLYLPLVLVAELAVVSDVCYGVLSG